MTFKLLFSMENRWRGINAPPLVAPVVAGVQVPNGEAAMFQPERADDNLFMPTLWMPVADLVPVQSA